MNEIDETTPYVCVVPRMRMVCFVRVREDHGVCRFRWSGQCEKIHPNPAAVFVCGRGVTLGRGVSVVFLLALCCEQTPIAPSSSGVPAAYACYPARGS